MQFKNIKRHLFLCFFFACIFSEMMAEAAVVVIPKPMKVIEKEGQFVLTAHTGIIGAQGLSNEIGLLRQSIWSDYGLRVKKSKGRNTQVSFVLDKAFGGSNPARYRLVVTEGSVTITAAEKLGIFYGMQTLRQLIKPGQNHMLRVPCVEIEDQPRFAWREFMLDEARYFKGKVAVKQILDQMALLKMNVFHWHLTDNTGWRFEVRKYPLLTKIGSRRDSSEVKINGKRGGFYDGKPHEGHYTQADIRDIVRYAAERHITIVPEIDMPGHTTAAIAAYPWLGSLDTLIKVPASFANQPNVLRVSDPRVWTFVTDVLDEVMELFPSKVIHIGGDEVKYDHWRRSPVIQSFIKNNQLASPADLQIWFTNKLSHYLESKNRRMMGWNEILGIKIHEETMPADIHVNTQLAKNVVVDFWKGDIQLMNNALAKGYQVINSLHTGTYLDYTGLSLKAAYHFEPVPKGLEAKFEPNILGSSCHMWSEWIPTVSNLQNLVFPRLAAYAEVGWTQKDNRSYADFMKSLPNLLEYWDKLGISHRVIPAIN